MVKKSESIKSLWEAAESGDLNVVKNALNKNFNPNNAKKDGLTLLMVAAQNGHINIVKELVRLGADVNQRRGDTITALVLACFYDHSNVVKFLVNHGADINLKYDIESDQGSIKNNTALILSAQQGRLGICKILIESGAEIEAASDAGYTPLIASMVNGGNKSLAKFLLMHGANPEPKSKSKLIYSRSTTPLILAAMNGWSDIVQKLIDMNVDVDATDGIDLALSGDCTALKHAVQNNQISVVKKLLLVGASVDKADFEGWTPLMNAAVEGATKLVKLLLQYGADPNIQNGRADSSSYGETALIHAARNGHADIVKLLLSAGADVNVDTLSGVSALTAAIKAYSRAEQYEGLGEKVAAFDLDNSIAQSFTSELRVRSLAVIDALLKNGADIDVQIDRIPLIDLIVEKNNTDLSFVFSKYGVDLNKKECEAGSQGDSQNVSDRFQVIRSKKIKSQVAEATRLKDELINELQDIIVKLPEFEREKGEVLRRLIMWSSESFDCILKDSDDILDEVEEGISSDLKQRSASMIGGEFFTTNEYPQNYGWMPVIQLDLREVSGLIGRNVGDGLLQLWYVQGQDILDNERQKIIVVPRSQISEMLLTEWHAHDYDEAEFTPIDPLTSDWCSYYWWRRWDNIVGVISKGVQCQNKLIESIVLSLNNHIDSKFSDKILLFSNLCAFEDPGWNSKSISLFGSFEPKIHSSADVNAECLVAFHSWGPSNVGNSQLFIVVDDNNISFDFRECWHDNLKDQQDEEISVLERRKNSKYVKQKKLDHDDFINHVR
jgi:ankyrin repeat protein